MVFKPKITEIRIEKVSNMPTHAQEEIVKKVVKMSDKFRKEYIGYVKITYVTSPTGIKIDKIEPIKGTIIDYFRTIKGWNTPVF